MVIDMSNTRILGLERVSIVRSLDEVQVVGQVSRGQVLLKDDDVRVIEGAMGMMRLFQRSER